jgi:hypothetical protein
MPNRPAVSRAFVAFLKARFAAGEIPNRAELASYLGKSRAWLTMVLDYEQGAIDVDTAFLIAAWFDTTPLSIAEGAAPPRIKRDDERVVFEVWNRLEQEQRPQALSVLRTFVRPAQQPPINAAAEPRGQVAGRKARRRHGKRRGA